MIQAMKQFLRRHPLVMPIVVLLLASLFGLALLADRAAIARQLRHFHLPWNLFLAWLTLCFALLVRFMANPWALLTQFLEWGGWVAERPSELVLPALFGSTMLLAYLLLASLLRPSLAEA